MKPEPEDMICDCCFRCGIHCLCDDSCENVFWEVKKGEYCRKCEELEQEENEA